MPVTPDVLCKSRSNGSTEIRSGRNQLRKYRSTTASRFVTSICSSDVRYESLFALLRVKSRSLDRLLLHFDVAADHASQRCANATHRRMRGAHLVCMYMSNTKPMSSASKATKRLDDTSTRASNETASGTRKSVSKPGHTALA